MPTELNLPPAASLDANSTEIIRVWLANDNQHVVLASGVWEDPASWGLMLADLARHVANMYQRDFGADGSAILQRVLDGFWAEIGDRTDQPTGD